jgi:hypothetical protein
MQAPAGGCEANYEGASLLSVALPPTRSRTRAFGLRVPMTQLPSAHETRPPTYNRLRSSASHANFFATTLAVRIRSPSNRAAIVDLRDAPVLVGRYGATAATAKQLRTNQRLRQPGLPEVGSSAGGTRTAAPSRTTVSTPAFSSMRLAAAACARASKRAMTGRAATGNDLSAAEFVSQAQALIGGARREVTIAIKPMAWQSTPIPAPEA